MKRILNWFIVLILIVSISFVSATILSPKAPPGLALNISDVPSLKNNNIWYGTNTFLMNATFRNVTVINTSKVCLNGVCQTDWLWTNVSGVTTSNQNVLIPNKLTVQNNLQVKQDIIGNNTLLLNGYGRPLLIYQDNGNWVIDGNYLDPLIGFSTFKLNTEPYTHIQMGYLVGSQDTTGLGVNNQILIHGDDYYPSDQIEFYDGEIYIDDTPNLHLNDNIQIILGSADDSYLKYDGTNLVISVDGEIDINNAGFDLDTIDNTNRSYSLVNSNILWAATQPLTGYPTKTAMTNYAGWYSTVSGWNATSFATLRGFSNLVQLISDQPLTYAYGADQRMEHRGGGNVYKAYGLYALATNNDGSGKETGNIDYLYGARFEIDSDKETGIVKNAYALSVGESNLANGLVTRAYGLSIDDISLATTNWAIKTGSGKVEFGDNTTILGNLNITGNFTGNQIYGFMYVHNESNDNTVISAPNTYYNISENVEAGELNGFTFNSNNALISIIGGIYSFHYNVGFSQATGTGDEWHFAIGVNNVPNLRCHMPRKIGTITDYGSAGSNCIFRLQANDVITAMIENENDNDDANIMDMQLSIIRIGD